MACFLNLEYRAETELEALLPLLDSKQLNCDVLLTAARFICQKNVDELDGIFSLEFSKNSNSENLIEKYLINVACVEPQIIFHFFAIFKHQNV